jgi:hypothetical protein
MSFRTNSSAESFLMSLAVSYVYNESVKYDELEPEWGTYNYGRPDNMARVESAIEAYASQGSHGSPFPAVIVRTTAKGLEVLDGFQRLHANSLLGNTTFAAYIVTCQEKTAQKIRLVANVRINGAAPVDPEWTLKRLVELFLIGGDDSEEDIAQLIGRDLRCVKKEHERQKTIRRVADACRAEGKEPPKFTETVYDTIADVAQPSDFAAQCRKPVVSFLCSLRDCSFKNGDNKRWIEHVFNIKRRGNKDRRTQFNSKVRDFHKDPLVSKKLAGKPLVDSLTNINAAVESLHTRVKNYRKQKHAALADEAIVRQWDDRLEETARWLRELCTTPVRRDIDPFIYG